MPTTDSRTNSPRRGVNGVILKVFRARDTRVSVIGREEVSEHFVRLRCRGDEVLAAEDLYPTYWLRLWFTEPGGKGHQRGYTVVDPDPATGEFSLEFYLHPGIASAWAQRATPGDEIEATILNGRPLVDPLPDHLVAVGDGASLPAILDTLRRTPDLPATVLLERGYPDDESVLPAPRPRAGQVDVRWFDRDGSIVDAALEAAASAPAGSVYFVSLEGEPTRRLSSALRKRLGVPKERVHALAYWKR